MLLTFTFVFVVYSAYFSSGSFFSFDGLSDLITSAIISAICFDLLQVSRTSFNVFPSRKTGVSVLLLRSAVRNSAVQLSSEKMNE